MPLGLKLLAAMRRNLKRGNSPRGGLPPQGDGRQPEAPGPGVKATYLYQNRAEPFLALLAHRLWTQPALDDRLMMRFLPRLGSLPNFWLAGGAVSLMQQWHAKTCAIPPRVDPRRWSRNIMSTAQMDLLGMPVARIARRTAAANAGKGTHQRAAVESMVSLVRRPRPSLAVLTLSLNGRGIEVPGHPSAISRNVLRAVSDSEPRRSARPASRVRAAPVTDASATALAGCPSGRRRLAFVGQGARTPNRRTLPWGDNRSSRCRDDRGPARRAQPF
jgi:hypothetical protein